MAGALLGYTAGRQLSQLLAAIVFFHGSEYALAVAFHGKSNISLSSLLISKQYILAMVCSLLEYTLEIIAFPELKEKWGLSNSGLMMVFIGEMIRKAAVLTAGRAFTHNIKIYHQEHHHLVTHGIYRFIRHPGYCGFFIWATGTQSCF
uniref:Protein-S-isoprenylcysteine O-methyltransferase n=1 Tax=Anthurium amnicola TaxID=1678845 RepID=A0A1D1Z7Y9_9ARAE